MTNNVKVAESSGNGMGGVASYFTASQANYLKPSFSDCFCEGGKGGGAKSSVPVGNQSGIFEVSDMGGGWKSIGQGRDGSREDGGWDVKSPKVFGWVFGSL